MNDGNDGNANGTGATETTPGSAQSRWQPRPIKVRGREVIIDSEEKANELLQKGAAAEERFAEAKKMREEAALERASIEQEKTRLNRLRGVDDLLSQDPEKRAKVNAILNGGDLNEATSDDPILAELERMDRRHRAEVSELTRQVNQLSSGVTSGLGSIRRDRTMDSDARQLQRNYPKLATDERIDEAREYAEKRGLSLDEAFRITSFEDVPEYVRGEVITEFGVDPNKIGPQRGEDLVLDGIGPVKDQETLDRLFEEDPDRYAAIRPQLRAWRLRRTGKLEVPR